MIEDSTFTGTTAPQRLVIVIPNGGTFDSRAMRIAATLRERGHDVRLAARSDGAPAPPRAGSVGRPTGSSATAEALRIVSVVKAMLTQRRGARGDVGDADVAHAMGFLALPVAQGGRSRNERPSVVYDARDLYASARNIARMPRFVRATVGWLERRWARRAHALVTVNGSLAVRQAVAWSVPRNAITVVHNCPPRYDPPADPVDHLRLAAGLAPGTPVALYHGGFSRGRGLEELAAAIREPGLEAVHAVFLGYGPLEPELRTWAADPASGDRLHVLPAVPPDELLDWITTADVAVVAIQPDTLNHRLSTPNKLFEAIAAGVPVVASDFAGIREIVADPTGPLGVLVDPTDPAAIAAAIRQLVSAPPAERAALRARCLAAAHERWNWETESAKLVELYGRLTGRPW